MKNNPFFTGLLFGVISFFIYCAWGFGQIDGSASSTACIAYFFLPIYAIGSIALPFFLIGFCAHYAMKKLRVSRRTWSGYFCIVITLALSMWFVDRYAQHLAHEREMAEVLKVVTEIREMPPSQYEDFLQNSPWRTNKYALSAFLEHSDLSADILYQIAQIPSAELHLRMGASPAIKGKNRKGLAVMRLVVLHPNVDERALALLAQSPDSYVQDTVARNPKTPVDIRKRLRQEQLRRQLDGSPRGHYRK